MTDIIEYDQRFRDDLIFMVLLAKDALGRLPRINADLLDVNACYRDAGGAFFLALDAGGRVIGSVGCSMLSEDEIRLHRLYVKPGHKRQGVGSRLLERSERYARDSGCRRISVHLGDARIYWESRPFYVAHAYAFTDGSHMMKTLTPPPPRYFR